MQRVLVPPYDDEVAPRSDSAADVAVATGEGVRSEALDLRVKPMDGDFALAGIGEAVEASPDVD